MNKNRYRLLLLPLLALAVGVGCVSHDHKTQAFEPGATNIEVVNSNLVFIPVRITPSQANLRLTGLFLEDQGTGQRFSYEFVASRLRGSRNAPAIIEDGNVQQILLVEMPAGSHRLVGLDFGIRHDPNSFGKMYVTLDDPLALDVQGHSYAGELGIDIVEVYIKGMGGLFNRTITFPLAKDEKIDSLFESMKGKLSINVEDRMETDLVKLVELYPGTADIEFATSLLR